LFPDEGDDTRQALSTFLVDRDRMRLPIHEPWNLHIDEVGADRCLAVAVKRWALDLPRPDIVLEDRFTYRRQWQWRLRGSSGGEGDTNFHCVIGVETELLCEPFREVRDAARPCVRTPIDRPRDRTLSSPRICDGTVDCFEVCLAGFCIVEAAGEIERVGIELTEKGGTVRSREEYFLEIGDV